MKRRLLIIAIFLLLGAVVNVAVAWGCAVVAPEYRTLQVQTVERDGGREAFLLLAAFGSEIVRPAGASSPWEKIFRPALRLSPSHSVWGVARRRGPKSSGVSVEEANGWPALCLRWYSSGRKVHGGLDLGGTRSYAILVDGTTRSPTGGGVGNRTIPLVPIWPGFAVNTLFYATLLWLLIPGPFALRRFLRLRRGLCPKCAYPIGESSVCTECGGALA